MFGVFDCFYNVVGAQFVEVSLGGEVFVDCYLVKLFFFLKRGYCTSGQPIFERAIEGTSTSGSAMEKHIISIDNRPLVNTAVQRGKKAHKAIASVRKGFVLSIPSDTILRISFIKCRDVRIDMKNEGALRVRLHRGAIVLSGIVVATLNLRGGRTSLTCSVRGIGKRRLAHVGRIGVVATLTNGTTKIRVGGGSSNVKNSTGIDLQKVHSTSNSGRPLCIVSNIPVLGVNARRTCSTVNNATGTKGQSKNSNVSGLGPRSIRDVDVLGNTPTTTLCKDRTTGKIVLVAAGGNGATKREGVRFSAKLAFSGTFDLPGVRGYCKIDSIMSD